MSSKNIVLFFAFIFMLSCSNVQDEGLDVIWEGKSYTFSYLKPTKKQPDRHRIWKKHELDPVFTIDDSLSLNLFQPQTFNLDKSNNIHILDVSDGKIKIYDSDGEFLAVKGGGLGRGPGQFSFPYDFSIDTVGRYYIVDLNTKMLTSLDSSGEFRWQKLFKLITPGTINSNSTNKVLVSIAGPTSTLFQSFDLDGKLINEYPSFLKRPPELPSTLNPFGLPMLGETIENDNGYIFVPRYFPQLIYYDSNGNIIKEVSTIDSISSNPVLNVANKNGYFLPEDFNGKVVNHGVSHFKDLLIVWSELGNIEFGTQVFDFYQKKTGNYLYSVKIPELGSVSQVVLKENRIYTMNYSTAIIESYSFIIDSASSASPKTAF
ncbi:MAG: hypothetical protein ABJK11_17615 [Balneola sp.]